MPREFPLLIVTLTSFKKGLQRRQKKRKDRGGWVVCGFSRRGYYVFVLSCFACCGSEKKYKYKYDKKNIKKVYKQKEKIGKFAISCAITRDQRLDQRVDQ